MPRALAIGAHPDDIEFVMAGTLLLLKEAGWELHYFNVSSGNLGSLTSPPAETARVRRAEARAAARVLGATWHPPICDDLQIFYDDRTLRRFAAVIRDAGPSVILTHAVRDYMEDHMTTSRLAVTAAFARELPGYRTIPRRAPSPGAVTIYHASPHGLRDGLRRVVRPGAFVDTTSVHDRKRAALECHTSQRRFLDVTQGMDDYVRTMEDFSRSVGKLSGRYRHAEGWRRHLHFGFCEPGADPLRDALGRHYLVSRAYESRLNAADGEGASGS
ncbi:MAG TPA: PIG-L family deacetylase [Vicinamibacterales bacterium]|nr:PIG-L family deacetylase [Vicinamibacterales bacterium]